MFRKDREAVRSYNKFKAEECVILQREIFEYAYTMLKPGGVIVYSTCTFNPDENERNIEYFINKYNLEVDRIDPIGGFEPARVHWGLSCGGEKAESLKGAVRLWPHKARGEVICLPSGKKGRSNNNTEQLQGRG